MSTEKLISASKLATVIRDDPYIHGKAYARVRDHIDDAPTVDAVEVVHARWIWSEENECWVCSNCELSALNNYRGNSTDSNYCPHCGAKMDGGNEDV